MRAVVQRVAEACVTVDGRTVGRIGRGLLVLVGVEQGDGGEDVAWLASKVVRMRIFDDESGRMNQSVVEIGGDALVVSQFTLHASTAKGNRPSFVRAARPEEAVAVYERFLAEIGTLIGRSPAAGVFGAAMRVSLVNDGPVTIVVDSRDRV